MFELRLLCPEERVEAVSDALEALDALSVSVEDADAQTPAIAGSRRKPETSFTIDAPASMAARATRAFTVSTETGMCG